MAKNDRITVRVDADVKKAADDLFRECGISMATAINLFLHRAVKENGLPFSVDADVKAGRTATNR